MKTSEFISELQKMPQNAYVYFVINKIYIHDTHHLETFGYGELDVEISEYPKGQVCIYSREPDEGE